VAAGDRTGAEQQLDAVPDDDDAALLVHEGARDVHGLLAEAEALGGVVTWIPSSRRRYQVQKRWRSSNWSAMRKRAFMRAPRRAWRE
jgi:hypothetical protein